MSNALWKERDLAEMVAKYGTKNIRFFVHLRPLQFVPMLGVAFTTLGDEEVMIECEIIEKRYKVSEGYKIQLVPVNSEPDDKGRVFESRSYYQMDLESLLRRNPDDFKVYVLLDEPVTYQRIDFVR